MATMKLETTRVFLVTNDGYVDIGAKMAARQVEHLRAQIAEISQRPTEQPLTVTLTTWPVIARVEATEA